jgi:hypothetical protein
MNWWNQTFVSLGVSTKPISATNAAINGPRTHLPSRFAEAVFVATALRNTSAYLQLHCPEEQQIGQRPDRQPPNDVGTACEPWQNRQIAEVLWQTLDSSMLGLEWSSGSGTAWLLRRGVTMHSIEHCEPWIKDIERKLQSVVADDTNTKWYPHYVPRQDGKGCSQDRAGGYTSSMQIFGEYAYYPRKHLLDQFAPGGFDLVEVDGRFRKGCMLEAAGLHKKEGKVVPPLVKQDYGLVLLDNSDRSRYDIVTEIPSHWLVVSFQTGNFGETSLWMACPTVDDAPCAQARSRIVDLMTMIPSENVGHRFTEHMARAVADGVPGAQGGFSVE